MQTNIEVRYCTLRCDSGGQAREFSDDGARGFRIAITCNGKRGVVPIKFARQRDAEQGVRSLLKIMTTDGTFDEVRERIRDIGHERIKKAVCESLAW